MAARILIAEDYDDNRELLRLLLANANYEVREARNGQECLTLACVDPLPDLIMVDLSMPELDGWEVFQRLKANADTAHIPCVAVTAHTRSFPEEMVLAAGCDAYVVKPINTRTLAKKIAEVIAKKEEKKYEYPGR